MTTKSKWIVVAGVAVATTFTAVGVTFAANSEGRREPPPVAQRAEPLKDLPAVPVTIDPSLKQSLARAQETGWTPVAVSEGKDGFVRTDEIDPRDPAKLPKYGQRLVVVDESGKKIGYWINPLGYVDAAKADAPGFSWQETLRREKPQIADEVLTVARTQQTMP